MSHRCVIKRDGRNVNYKRSYRIYTAEGLIWLKATPETCWRTSPRVSWVNWSLSMLFDGFYVHQLFDGRKFGIFTLVNNCSHNAWRCIVANHCGELMWCPSVPEIACVNFVSTNGGRKRKKTTLFDTPENKKTLQVITYKVFPVPRTGFEPAHLAAPPPEDGASTNFATWASLILPTTIGRPHFPQSSSPDRLNGLQI